MQCEKHFTDSIFYKPPKWKRNPVSGLLPVLVVSPQFVCIAVLQHKSEWMDFLTELISRLTGRNEVRWRLVQDASLAPHFRTWGLLEANVLYWRMYVWHCYDFLAPPQYFSAPRVIRRPGNCAPLPLRYAPADRTIMQPVKSYRCLR